MHPNTECVDITLIEHAVYRRHLRHDPRRATLTPAGKMSHDIPLQNRKQRAVGVERPQQVGYLQRSIHHDSKSTARLPGLRPRRSQKTVRANHPTSWLDRAPSGISAKTKRHATWQVQSFPVPVLRAGIHEREVLSVLQRAPCVDELDQHRGLVDG
jgi:hypothetical protein